MGHKERQRERSRRYRQKHSIRIDYYPSPDVEDILLHHQKHGHEPCLAGIIDGLVRVGHRTVTGNTRGAR